jgi:lysophospholipase
VPLASAVMNALGRSRDFVWGMDKRDPATMAFNRQLVTSDPARFARTQALLRANPALTLAGATWGWLKAAYRSLAEIGEPDYAPVISTPVLICGAGKDRICVTAAAESFARRMPLAHYLEIPESEHEILMERDFIRERFWAAFDNFLAKKEPHRND